MDPSAELNRRQERNRLLKLYETRRRIITRDLQYDTSNCTLIIWNRNGPIIPDFLDTFIEDLTPDAETRYHWTPQLPWYQNFPTGATAVFDNVEITNLVAKKLQMYSRNIMAVPFELFFQAVVEVEVRHRDFEGDFTQVIIKGNEPFDDDSKIRFERKLLAFGQYEFINFNKNIFEHGAICTVVYRFAAEAVAAKLILDDSDIYNIGRISVEVQMTSKVRQILGYVKNYFM